MVCDEGSATGNNPEEIRNHSRSILPRLILLAGVAYYRDSSGLSSILPRLLLGDRRKEKNQEKKGREKKQN